jgi:hypothetical protein
LKKQFKTVFGKNCKKSVNFMTKKLYQFCNRLAAGKVICFLIKGKNEMFEILSIKSFSSFQQLFGQPSFVDLVDCFILLRGSFH